MVSEQEIRQYLSQFNLGKEEQEYLDFHAKRLTYSTNKVQQYCEEFQARKVLDIGPHFLTLCIRHFIEPKVTVSTLGWRYERIVPSSSCEEHCEFDLNDCVKKDIPLEKHTFDLVIFSETIEHLYTSPSLILPKLYDLLRPGTGGLFLQTPNAVTLKHRLKMMCGRNPYELIRKEQENPGHFREYTLKELISYGLAAGFSVLNYEYCDYWKSKNPLVALPENAIPSFRQGMTVIFQN